MNTENTADRVLKIIAGGPSFAIQSARQALEDAARSLETIAELAGRDETLLEPDQVRGYAASRAYMARVALATPGQPQPASAEAIPAEQAEIPNIDERIAQAQRKVAIQAEADERIKAVGTPAEQAAPTEPIAWAIPSTKQFSWDQQDTRYWTPLVAAHPHEAADRSAEAKDAARWRRLVNASEMPFPVATIADDPENDCNLIYGRTGLERLIDSYDEISDSYAAMGTPAAAEPGKGEGK